MPHRVRTETGALVTLSDDFFDEEVHEEVKGNPDESPLLPDGVTYRPPTYPVEDDRQEGGEHDQDSDGHEAESTEKERLT